MRKDFVTSIVIAFIFLGIIDILFILYHISTLYSRTKRRYSLQGTGNIHRRQNRTVNDARVYIQEYPQYGTNPPDGSYIDLNDAFYNDAPYTGIWKYEITIPSGTIQVGEEFHACLEDTNKENYSSML